MAVGRITRDDLTAEFFDGTARGEFLLRYCVDCGAVSTPRVQQCHVCNSTNLDWRTASGEARIVSWTVNHPKPSIDPVPPQIVVIAEFEEGPWWWSELQEADPAQLSVGARLTVGFERESESSEFVPVFRLA
ncbi:MAG: OB-fold domain-containing protein [Acidimicrobiales bacterium]